MNKTDFNFGNRFLEYTDLYEYVSNQNNLGLQSSLDFNYCPVDYPTQFVKNLSNSSNPAKEIAAFYKGTTTLGFVFQGGVLIAVDSRASMGQFNSSETVRKVNEINNRTLGTMAGGAADCAFWEENLARAVKLYELNYGEEMSVSAASQIFINMLREQKKSGLSVGTMLAGSDSDGEHLYYCDNDGTRIKGQKFAIGSGGTYAYGILDTHHRFDLTIEEAVILGKRAISEATYMDSGSGGVVRVYLVHQGGWTKLIEGDDNSNEIWKHRNNKRVSPPGLENIL
mgnify:CR=1 FL=1